MANKMDKCMFLDIVDAMIKSYDQNFDFHFAPVKIKLDLTESAAYRGLKIVLSYYFTTREIERIEGYAAAAAKLSTNDSTSITIDELYNKIMSDRKGK